MDTDRYNICPAVNDDMLGGEIMERLGILGQARFRAVCKDWLAIHQNYTTMKSILPWYALYDYEAPMDRDKLEFRLYDPLSTPNLVSVQQISLTELGIPSPCCYVKTWVTQVTLKNSWFFIGINRPVFFYTTTCSFLAYCPFTKQLIKLPKLDHQSGYTYQLTFTTVPDSPSCVFFVMCPPTVNKYVWATCRKGDSEWTIRQFDRVDAFYDCDNVSVFFHENMYIVSPYGQLASYNIVDEKFRYENLVRDEIFTLNYHSYSEYRAFELNGELMMLYLDSQVEIFYTSPCKQCIKQFDWSNKVWIPVTTLADTTLFVSPDVFSVGMINREETRYNRILSNKIYNFYDGGCTIYSVENGDLVPFKSVNSSSLIDGCGDLPEYKYSCGFRSTFYERYHFIKSACIR